MSINPSVYKLKFLKKLIKLLRRGSYAMQSFNRLYALRSYPIFPPFFFFYIVKYGKIFIFISLIVNALYLDWVISIRNNPLRLADITRAVRQTDVSVNLRESCKEQSFKRFNRFGGYITLPCRGLHIFKSI